MASRRFQAFPIPLLPSRYAPMKPKTLILMAVAIVCGLGASYMTSRLLAERQTSDPDKVKVLVARKNLNMGEPIKTVDDLFEEKEFLRGQEPRNAIDSPDALT